MFSIVLFFILDAYCIYLYIVHCIVDKIQSSHLVFDETCAKINCIHIPAVFYLMQQSELETINGINLLVLLYSVGVFQLIFVSRFFFL